MEEMGAGRVGIGEGDSRGTERGVRGGAGEVSRRNRPAMGNCGALKQLSPSPAHLEVLWGVESYCG